MASSDLSEGLTCSICLNYCTDPVTLKCGHNFCGVCMVRAKDRQKEYGAYTCLACSALWERHSRLRNITLPPTEDCSPVPDVESCLMNEASLCDDDFHSHRKSSEHVLSTPTTPLGTRKFPAQGEILDDSCTKDAACGNVTCIASGEHQSFPVEILNEATDNKEKLINALEGQILQRKETERTLQESMHKVNEKAARVTGRVTALLRDIKRQLIDVEERVLNEIYKQEEKVLLSFSDQIQELEIKKDELSNEIRQIGELCNMSDPVTVLQESDTGDLGNREKGEHLQTDKPTGNGKVCDVGDLDEGLISVLLYAGLSDILTAVNEGNSLHEHIDLLWDTNTAGRKVHISGDLRTASRSEVELQRSDSPERVLYCQVLSARSFSSGRHYWEVETSRWSWRLGMSYPSSHREGSLGFNDKSWCLCRWYNTDQYKATHNSKSIEIALNVPCHRFAVYLDYEAGQLSFYALCDPIRHLHTFTTTFTEPLHAAAWVWGYSMLYKSVWVRIKCYKTLS